MDWIAELSVSWLLAVGRHEPTGAGKDGAAGMRLDKDGANGSRIGPAPFQLQAVMWWAIAALRRTSLHLFTTTPRGLLLDQTPGHLLVPEARS